MLIVAITPLIVYLKVMDFSGFLGMQAESVTDADFFSHYKAVFLILTSMFFFALYGVDHWNHRLNVEKKPFDIAIGLYLALILLSVLFSTHKMVSLIGYMQRYEGGIVLIVYLLLLFTVSKYDYDEKQAMSVLKALAVSAGVISVIGIFQFFKMDFFRSALGVQLITPPSLNLTVEQLNFTMPVTQIYSTLQNSNYVGSYFALALPLLAFLMFYFKELKYRVSFGIIFFISILNLLGSRSRAGLVGVAVVVFLALIIYRTKLKEKWKLAVLTLCLAIAAFFTVNLMTNSQITNRLANTWQQLFETTNSYGDQRIVTKGDTLEIALQTDLLRIRESNQELEFLDQNDNPLEIMMEESHYTFLDPRYSEFGFEISDVGYTLISLKFKDQIFRFVLVEGHFKLLLESNVAVDLVPVEKWGFEGREKLGSSRGYIWSRSLPLLKDTTLIGFGPDTYALNFPQLDYVGKQLFLYTPEIVVDKPHTLFLQTAINTGLTSLFCMLFLIGLYLKQSIQLYVKSHEASFFTGIGSVIFMGVFGYIAAAFFNDSIVGIAPLFWIFLGLGFSVNRKLNLSLQK
jgi:O-antigen ligase